MNVNFTLYIIPLLLSAIITLVLATQVWQQRDMPGARVFVLFLVAVTLWSLAYALELITVDLATKIFWAKIKYIAIVSIPFTWFVFAFQYSYRGQQLAWPYLTLLTIMPLLTLIIVWSNEFHNLIWIQPTLGKGGPFTVIVKTYGLWFWFYLFYTYMLFLAGSLLLIRLLIRDPYIYRRQITLLLIGIGIPWLANIIFIFGLSPIPNLQLTPFAFTISGLTVGLAILRFHLLDVVPIAHRVILDSMSEGMIVLDAENRVVDLNPAVQSIVKLNATAVLGKVDTEVFADLPDLIDFYHHNNQLKTEIIIADGPAQRVFEVEVSSLYSRKKRFRGRLILLRDITHYKQAEAEREYLLAREQEQRLLTETLREVTLALTSQTNLRAVLDEVLRQTQRIVSYHTAHIMLLEGEDLRIGARYGYQSFGSDNLMSELVQPLISFPLDARVVQSRNPLVIPDTERESSWIIQDETAWVKSHLVAPLVLQDRVLGLLRLDGNMPNQFSEEDMLHLAPLASAAAIAIENAQLLATEQERAKQLTQARDHALQASRLKSELLARVSHELRTPLNIILGYSEMLQASMFGDISAEQAETTEKIISSAVDLTNRINDLLDQARSEADNLRIIMAPLTLIDLIEQIYDKMNGAAQAKSLQFTWEISPDLPAILTGDYKRLYQILYNLVDNAIKFTPDGNIHIRVYRPQEEVWCLEVSDTGLGIPLEAHPYIFDPFWQLDSSISREYGGTGLGLSIIKQLIELMKGQIMVVSKPNHGSTFTILLPLIVTSEVRS